ncbi:MAG: prepilin peptidase [Candidatus Nealsonbacteria bacterium]
MTLYFFIFGLIVGSFLNCVIYRLQEGKSFLFSRSSCPHCNHKLSWQDLIPVFSFLILKGKCRYCKKKISLQYPLVEFSTGILFVLIFNLVAIGPHLFYYLLISCFLVVIFVYDLKHYIIPDKVIYPAIFFAFIFLFYQPLVFKNLIFSAISAAGFFLAIVLISKGRWMGIGDIKLAFLMGIFLGWPNIAIALFLAFFIGAIIGVGLILKKKKSLKSELPFGPFLVLGTFIALFWGEKIINWYLSVIF